MHLHIPKPHLSKEELQKKFKAAALATAVIFTPLAGIAAQQAGTVSEAQIPSQHSSVPVASPPESEPDGRPHRFTHIQSFVPLFTTDDERHRNIFFTRNRDSIAEYRRLTNSTETGPLTRAEQREIADIQAASRADAREYRIPLGVAATLHFAARRTGTDFDAMVARLQENSGNVMNVSPARLRGDNVYKFNVSTWLYLVKTHGHEHGLGFFADNIDVSRPLAGPNGRMTVDVNVNDPAVLREIVAMRQNPRLSVLLGAEYVAHESEVPQTAYRGMNYVYDAKIAEEQRDLMTIGFDLGIRGADGIRGPLSAAAMQEFTQMIRPLLRPGQSAGEALQEVARQAVNDAAFYAAYNPNITPATAFAVRHASRVSNVDFGYLMQLAGAESGFDPGISASTSSATGLFQFIDNTWLISLHNHGAKHGLADIAGRIEVERNASGDITSARIADPLVERYALSLRSDPRIMALMGAEFAKENYDALQSALPNRNITRTDQYLAHFLGSGQATTFLQRMNRNPNARASSLFPDAAHANRNIFYRRGGGARSLREVYGLFTAKFDSEFFDAPAPPVAVTPASNPRRPA